MGLLSMGGAKKEPQRYIVERHDVTAVDDVALNALVSKFIEAHDEDYAIQAPSIILESGKCWVVLFGTHRSQVDQEVVQGAKRNARAQVEGALEAQRLMEAASGGVQPAHAAQIPQAGLGRGTPGAFGKGR